MIAILGVAVCANGNEPDDVLNEPLGLSGVRASFVAPRSGTYDLWLIVASPVTDTGDPKMIYDAMQSVGKEYHGDLDLSWWIENQGVRVVERRRLEKVHGTVQIGSGAFGPPPFTGEGIVIDRFDLVGGETYGLTVAPGASFAEILPASPTLVLNKKPTWLTK